MFAVVVDDATRDLVWAARDRMGQKPLFADQRRFDARACLLGFTSELKAFHGEDHALNRFDRTLSRASSPTTSSPTAKGSLKGLKKSHPERSGFSNAASRSAASSADRTGRPPSAPRRASADALDNLDQAIDEAVQARLVADVPLGIFYLEASIQALSRLMHPTYRPAQLKTFAIGFEEKSFDESEHAEAVAHHLGVRHQTKTIGAKTCSIPYLRSLLDSMNPLPIQASFPPAS